MAAEGRCQYGCHPWIKKNHGRRGVSGQPETPLDTPLQGEANRTVARPALCVRGAYGAETWALKKAQEKKLEVGRTHSNATMDVHS